MEHLKTILTFPDLMQFKAVGVGGLRGGYTNSFPPAAPLNPRFERGALVGAGPSYSTLTTSHAWWFWFRVVPQLGLFLSPIRKHPLSPRRALCPDSPHRRWLPAGLPSSICLCLCGAAIRSEADKAQFSSADERAEQDTFPGPSRRAFPRRATRMARF